MQLAGVSRQPILMYHEVGPRETLTERYTVATEEFVLQLRFLRDHGFRVLTVGEYWRERRRSAGRAPAKTVVITFDDNNICHFTASMPLLLEHGFKATYFIVSSHLDAMVDAVTSAQVREMHHAGMEIGSHSHTHRFLAGLRDADLSDELRRSKALIEECIQAPVHHVSCPGGNFSRRVLNAALAAGYETVSTSEPGMNEVVQVSRTPALRRFLVSKDTRLARFRAYVEGESGVIAREMLMHRAKFGVKKLVGTGLYHKAWQALRRDA